MSFHNELTGTDIHVPYAYTYANQSARTGATGFVTADVGKLALQSDENSLWMLTATTPTWLEISAHSYSTVSVYSADGTLTGNRTVTGYSGNSLSLEHYNDADGSAYTLRSEVVLEDNDIRLEVFLGDGFGADLSSKKLEITNSQMLITDGAGTKGLEYAADYSSNFTDHSLITKSFLEVSTAARTLQTQNSTQFLLESVEDDGTTVGDDKVQLALNDGGGSHFWRVEEDGVGAQTYAGFVIASDGGLSIIDSVADTGISYSANYAANFGDRSIPDVNYVLNTSFPRVDGADLTTLTLSGMTNTNFNGDYEEMTNFGTTGASAQFNFSTSHKSYWRYDGSSTWYVVLWSTSASQWEAIDSITDPETWLDNEDLSGLVSNTETFTGSSQTAEGGESIPSDNDSNVAHDQKVDLERSSELFLSGDRVDYYHGSSSAASPVNLLTFYGDHSGTDLEPYITFHQGLDVGNSATVNYGKGTKLKWNDGTKSTDVLSITATVNGSDVFQQMDWDFHGIEQRWDQIEEWNLYFDTATGTAVFWEDNTETNEVFEINYGQLKVHKPLWMVDSSLRLYARTTTADDYRFQTQGDDLQIAYRDNSAATTTEIARFSVANSSLEFPSDFGVQFDHAGGSGNGYWLIEHNDTNDDLEILHNNGSSTTTYLEIDDSTLAANFHGDVTADSFDLHPYQVALGNPSTNGVVISLDDGSTVPSEVQLAIDTIEVANASIYTLATNAITVLKAGNFQVSLGVLIDETNSSGGQRGRVSVYMKKNGTQVDHSIGATYFRELTPGTGINVTFIETVAANDVLTFWALMEGETANDPPNTEQGETHVSIIQVGP